MPDKHPHTESCVVLCIDTSGVVCQAAVGIGDQGGFRLLTHAAVSDRRAHSENLIELIDFCLRKSLFRNDQISMIALSIGPGSFTGLRIGVSVAKGLGFSLQIPVIPVSTHNAMAYPFRHFPFPLWVMNTARKNEWYVTRYHGEHSAATVVMKTQQWLEEIQSTVILIADDIPLIQSLITDEKRQWIILPNQSCIVPDMQGLGALANQRYRAGDIPNIDELVPEYIQPFLGKI